MAKETDELVAECLFSPDKPVAGILISLGQWLSGEIHRSQPHPPATYPIYNFRGLNLQYYQTIEDISNTHIRTMYNVQFTSLLYKNLVIKNR